jgi:hypothetical protein
LLPFTLAALALAVAEPRTAYAFTWPVLLGAFVWIVLAAVAPHQVAWTLDVAATLAALPLLVLLLPFLPGVVMADGMKSLAILAGIEALLLGVVLPALDGLLVRAPAAGHS